jgi:vacuolar-type H+-ATPase subunit H
VVAEFESTVKNEAGQKAEEIIAQAKETSARIIAEAAEKAKKQAEQ